VLLLAVIEFFLDGLLFVELLRRLRLELGLRLLPALSLLLVGLLILENLSLALVDDL